MSRTNTTKELIILSHNDLDMAGSVLNIEYAIPTVPKKYFYTNYGNIKDIVQDIEDYITRNGNTNCLITDVSWSTSPDELHKLCSLFKNITLIDHHLYPEGFFDNYPNLKVFYDKTKSATKLTAEFFGNVGKSKELDEITNLIDVYDLWQSKREEFLDSQDLNSIFWEIGQEKFINDFIKSNFNFPFYYKNAVNEFNTKADAAIKSYEKRNLIHRTPKITIAFVDEYLYFNKILIEDMRKGTDFLINATSYGIIKVRISADANINSDQKDELRIRLTGTKDIGHENAFTYKMKDKISFDNLIKEIKKVVDNINDVCYKG